VSVAFACMSFVITNFVITKLINFVITNFVNFVISSFAKSPLDSVIAEVQNTHADYH